MINAHDTETSTLLARARSCHNRVLEGNLDQVRKCTGIKDKPVVFIEHTSRPIDRTVYTGKIVRTFMVNSDSQRLLLVTDIVHMVGGEITFVLQDSKLRAQCWRKNGELHEIYHGVLAIVP